MCSSTGWWWLRASVRPFSVLTMRWIQQAACRLPVASPSFRVVVPRLRRPCPGAAAPPPLSSSCRRPCPPQHLHPAVITPVHHGFSTSDCINKIQEGRFGFLLQKICRYVLQESYVFLTTSLEFVQIKIGQCNLMCSYASYFDSLSIS
jgi:hypothetical protein